MFTYKVASKEVGSNGSNTVLIRLLMVVVIQITVVCIESNINVTYTDNVGM